jgi:hypothetical protein
MPGYGSTVSQYHITVQVLDTGIEDLFLTLCGMTGQHAAAADRL